MADETNQSQQVPPSAPVPPVSNGTNNDKTMAIIAYIIFFIPLLVSKNRSTFLNYHINQGLGLFIVSLVGNLILGAVFSNLSQITNLWGLLMLILMVIGIINASKNETKPLPVIGNWFHIIK
jgi:uncharacterized membrane protein